MDPNDTEEQQRNFHKDLLVKCYLGPDVPAGKRPNGGWNINGPKVAKILDE